MSLLQALGFFAFWLILAYLAFTNRDAVASLFAHTRNLVVADILALQGR